MTERISDRSVIQAAASRWLEALTVGSRESVALVGRHGDLRYLSVSPTLGDLLGYAPEELSQGLAFDLVHPEDRGMLRRSFAALAGDDGAVHSVDYRVRHKLGHYVRLSSTAANRLNDDMVRAIVVHTRGAHTPANTGEGSLLVQPRPVFLEAVQQAIERSRRNATYGFSVLIIELARSKMLLGSYGQEIVDEVLSKAAARVASLLRPGDTLGSLGGGELAVLLDGVRDRANAAQVAGRIQSTVAMRYHIGDHAIDTAAIVGIATSERVYERAADVLRDAALASNRARGHGRKLRAVFQTQMRVEDTRFMAMVSELHNALREGQFVLNYQPIVSLGTHTLSGFEALVRWHHPKLGVISPTQFIPVAEETGLIEPLGRWVLEEACRQMVEWGEPGLHVSVNLSNKQFADEDLSAHVEQVLQITGLEPERLKLEITESAVLENQDLATKILGRLKTHGVRVSLDDFGTGYSSFSYLCQLPYDTLKIDRSFISHIGDDGENTDVIHAIIVLAHNLRMEVVAEGVETALQAATLKSMWCEYAQGFYFSKPLDAALAGQMIDAHPQW